MFKNKLLCKIAVVATSMALGISVTVSAIMVENKTAINNFFNTTEVEIYTPEDDTTNKEYFTSEYSSIKDLRTAGKTAAQRVEEEGAVLLKNDNGALPLETSASDKKKISLFSVSSVDPAYGGRGSAQSGSASDQVTPQQGFEQAEYEVNTDLLDFYKNNQSKYARGNGRGNLARINDAPWTDITAAVPESKIAEYGDAAIFILTRVGGEGADASNTGTDGADGDYLKLSANEKSVLEGLAQMKQSGRVKRVVLLLNVANQVECKGFLADGLGVDAVLWIGSVGITGFNAVADIIAGKVNPSGHLADTFWYEHDENPAYYNFGDNTYENYSSFAYLPMFGGGPNPQYGKYVVYQEGLYVGYRYTETRYYDAVTGGNDANFNYEEAVSYPFGYGMSYTTFTHGALNVTDNSDGTYTASVTVTNTGARAGKDVVQIYVQKPYGELSKTRKIQTPVLELVGYAKTDVLAPAGQTGSSQTVEITVNKSDFTSYDAEVDKTYILAGGNYRLVEGADVHEAVDNLLAFEGNTEVAGDENKVVNFEIAYDNTTYSVSNGKAVTNLFDDGNVNKYFESSENSVEYLSRDNWAESFPTGGVKLKMTEKLAKALMAQDDPSQLVKRDNEEYPAYGKIEGEKIRLIDLLVDEDGNKRDESYYAYDAEIWDKFLDQLTWDETIELLNTGLRSTAPLASMLKPATVEHNGPLGVTSAYNVNPNGLATRMKDPDSNQIPPYYPCVGVLAATFNEELAALFGNMMGEDAIWAGYGGLYGIGLNIHRSPYGGRLYEYYSEDPFLTGHMAAAEVKALQAHGCNAYIKHFALNDQETNRAGLGVWVDEQTLREIYLKPFYIAVNEGGAMNAMAAFNRLGATHCPANKALLTDFLKGEAGLKGFVVTDMYAIGYSMQQMPIFMAAGCDLPDGEIQKLNPYQVYKNGYGGLAQNMRDAAKRIMYATVKSNSMNGISVRSQVNSVMPAWRVALIVLDCLFGVLFAASAAWAVVLILNDKGIIGAGRVDSNKNKNENQGELNQ